MLLFFFQAADVLKDIIINAQEQSLNSCEYSYNQLVVLIVWSLSVNVSLLCLVMIMDSWIKLRKFIRFLKDKLK